MTTYQNVDNQRTPDVIRAAMAAGNMKNNSKRRRLTKELQKALRPATRVPASRMYVKSR